MALSTVIHPAVIRNSLPRLVESDPLETPTERRTMMQEPEKTKRARGSGSIYRNGSSIWWVKFSDPGRATRESSHSTDYTVAEKLLKRRLAEVLTDTFVPRQNIKVDALIQD